MVGGYGEEAIENCSGGKSRIVCKIRTETAMLDLPNMQNRKPEAIKRYLEFRLQQFKMLLDAVEDYVEEKYPATGGHS